MSRTRRIRQVLEPEVAKREVENISKMYQALGWVVHVTSSTDNGPVVHKITARKGKQSSVIVELEEAKIDTRIHEPVAPDKHPPAARHVPPTSVEIEPRRIARTETTTEVKIEPKVKTQPRPPESRPKSVEKPPKQVEKPPEAKKPTERESLLKENLKLYIEQDETGIVPALVAEGVLVIENGSVTVKKWIDRDKYLHAREYLKRVGVNL